MKNTFDPNPPKAAFNYIPKGQNCLIETEEFVERLIFSKQDLKEWEKVVLEQLEKYLTQREFSVTDPTVKLRFLYGQGWNIANTFEALKYHLKWKQEWPAIKSLIPVLQPLLSSGGVYLFGRDKQFRPAIIIRLAKLQSFNYHLHLAAAYFLSELMLDKMIPGQVENWVLVADMKDFPITELGSQKKLISELLTHYPCRVGKIFVVNSDRGLHGLDRLVPQNTLHKVVLIENKADLLNSFDPEQLECKYGGSANNLKAYWPVGCPSRGDSIQELLSSHSSYREYFQGNQKYSDLSSLKASQVEKESFISNNEFKDEIWQRLELVSASYSFLAVDYMKTQGDEERKIEKKKISNELTLASSKAIKKILKDDSSIPLFCSFCNEDCVIF